MSAATTTTTAARAFEAPAAPTRALVTRREVTIALVSGLLVGFVLVLQVLTLQSSRAPEFLRLDLVFAEPASGAEAMVARMDGHFTAELAADPTLAETERDFAPDPTDGAYRSSRPLLGWLAWLGSAGGRRPLIAPAILVLTALSAAALTLAVAMTGRSLGWTVRAPWLVLLAPGAAVAVWNPGLTEVLGLSLGLFGFVAHRRDRMGWSMLLFAGAVLCRETTILIPIGLALADLVTGRRWRSVGGPAVAAATYLAWTKVVEILLGHTSRAGGGRQLAAPGVGLIESIQHWSSLELACLLVIAVSVVAAWRSGNPQVRAIVLVHLGFASVMGAVVWSDWWAFGRLLLPLSALGVASLRSVGPVAPRTESPAVLPARSAT